MILAEFIGLLENRLQQTLPGLTAQLKMSAIKRVHELLRNGSFDHARQSSVLILFFPLAEKIGFVLMLRPEYDGVHSGQVSFPGGKHEETDESLVFTALREAREEIGIDPRKIQVIGQLTELYIPPSNFLVTPVAGFQATRPQFVADPKEVARIIEVDLDELLDDNNCQIREIKLKSGTSLMAPVYILNGQIVWGATAMMLSELKEILKEMLKS